MQLSEKQQRNMQFLILHRDFNKSQADIKHYFAECGIQVSQSTISTGIREAKLLEKIEEYEQNINTIKKAIGSTELNLINPIIRFPKPLKSQE